MTKALTKAEKKQRKEERKKGNQQKPPSPTVKTIQQPKRPNLEKNLCDDCTYEVGQCDGTPKFASDFDPNLKGAAADRVVECVGFLHIDKLPDDQGRTGNDEEPAAGTGAAHAGDDQPPQEDEPELIHAKEKDGATEEGKAEDLVVMKADAIQRAPLDRFEKDKADYGTCPSCGTPLKRTTYSRYVDAIRCTKTGCSNYRNIVKTVPSGAK